MPFLIYDYVNQHGLNEFNAWTLGLEKPQRAKLNEKIDKLALYGDALYPEMLAGSSVAGIQKLKVKGNVQLRPLLCKGPVNIQDEYTLLIGAKEVGDKWVPKGAPSTAATKKQKLLKTQQKGELNMKEFFNRLKSDFSDKEYAHSYMESHAVSRLAAQIHTLRNQRGWSQEQLAAHSGIAQERISKIESADFDSLTMKTLQKFSKAFDVNLHIEFESFSRAILDVANLNREQLEVKSREDDLAKSFTNNTLFVLGGGEWKAINHLQVVKIVSPSQPLKLQANTTWQNLDVPQKIAHHG